MQIHNGTLKSLVYSSMNWISMFIILITDYFQLCLTTFLMLENIYELLELITFIKPLEKPDYFPHY